MFHRLTSRTHSCRAYHPLQLVDTLYKCLSITADCVVIKVDRNTGRTQDWTARSFVICPACLLIILCYSDSDLFKKGCLKSFLTAKVKSLMIKCINHGFRSDRVSAVGLAVLCCVVTHVFRSNRAQSLTLN